MIKLENNYHTTYAKAKTRMYRKINNNSFSAVLQTNSSISLQLKPQIILMKCKGYTPVKLSQAPPRRY